MIYQHEGTTTNIRLEPLGGSETGTYLAVIDDREMIVKVQAIADGWLLTIDGVRTRVYTAVQGNERFAALNGEMYRLSVAENRRRGAGGGSGDLTAQMPGQVREILVQVGDRVTRGQTLLLLEAMKMEIRVSAPADGRVKAVLVVVGEVVDRGQRLVELTKDE